MTPKVKKRFERYSLSETTWDPVHGGVRPLVSWDDDATYDLGSDPSGEIFTMIADRMMSGTYYPADAVTFFGKWLDEARAMRAGDRVLQLAQIGPIRLWSMAQLYIADRADDTCQIGYVTTTRHFGRGIWTAKLTRAGTKLSLHVKSTAGPGSLLFWFGLPVARYYQLRARRRAIEEFKRIAAESVPDRRQ